jgi:5-methylcytosine-specific restriction endonuclease McrA
MGRLNTTKPNYPKTSIKKNCLNCGIEMWIEQNRLKSGRGKFCTAACRRLGIFTQEVRKKMSDKKKGKPSGRGGERCHFWKGGVTEVNRVIRMSTEMRNWKRAVFERDNYTCIWCGTKGDINADHIKPFATYPDLRFDVDNGRTLCVPCHKKTDTYGGKMNRKN